MKKIAFFLAALLSFQLSFGQNEFKIGPVIGINTTSIKPGDLTDLQALGIRTQESQIGYKVGLFARIPLGGLYLQPSVLLRTSSATYSFEDLSNPGQIQFKDENYLNFDVPAVVGAKLLFLRLHAGPVASIRMNTNSKVFDQREGYERTFDRVNWGLMLGTGVDLWKFVVDVNYQMPIVSGQDGVRFNGTDYVLNSEKGQLSVTLGYSF